MSIEEFLILAGSRPLLLLLFFVSVPILAWLMGLTHSQAASANAPWKYLYSTFVHLACVPGVFAAVVVAYTALFTRESLLKLDIVVTFLPIVSMVATLVVIAKRVDLDRLPGFGRLWGLITLLAVSFVLALLLDRLRVWILFGGGMLSLLVIAAVFYLVLRASTKALVGRRS